MKLLTHIASWAVVCILPALIFISEGNQRFEEALYRSLISLPFLMFLFYISFYWLIDKLWFKKRYILFIWVAVALILCMSYSKYELFSYFNLHKGKHKMPPFHAFMYFDFLSNLLPIVFAMAIRLCTAQLFFGNRPKRSTSAQTTSRPYPIEIPTSTAFLFQCAQQYLFAYCF